MFHTLGSLIRAMEIYKLSLILIRFMRSSMSNWKTTLYLSHNQGTIKTRSICIKSDIFQGDSLSPLLFCLTLAPLSTILNSTGYGCEVGGKKISHLFYMEDLKTYAKNDTQQEGLLKTIKAFNDDIFMQFGLEKCAKATIKRGKLTQTTDIRVDINTTIKELEQESAYKYLAINEGDGIQHTAMRERIRKEHYRRVRLATKSELNGSNKIDNQYTCCACIYIQC